MKCDVLVVGAGPAGSMAAKTVAETGMDVLLIEEDNEIGTPVCCAEGINKFLFQDTKVKKDDSFIMQKIVGTKIYFYDEVYELNTNQWQGYTIDRKVFDKYLANHAKSAGAKIETRVKAIGMNEKGDKKLVDVDFKGKKEKIESTVVVGAGGFGCGIGKWAGIKKHWKSNEFCKCFEYELGDLKLKEDDKFHIFFGEEFPMGYAWIFPKGNSVANVGVGVDPKANAKEALDFFMKGYPRVSNMIGRDYAISEVRGGCIPMTGPLSVDEVVSDGVVLIGDAAGIVDPITGEGITSAMLSGIAAGEVIGEALKKGDWSKRTLSAYYERWRSKRYSGGLLLGEDLDLLTDIKGLFFRVFTTRTIPKKARENFISAIIVDDIEETKGLVSKIQTMLDRNL